MNPIENLKDLIIYQSKNNPKIAYRIYKEFAEYKFNGYNDDILIENLQKIIYLMKIIIYNKK